MIFIKKPELKESVTVSTIPMPAASAKEVDTEGSCFLFCCSTP